MIDAQESLGAARSASENDLAMVRFLAGVVGEVIDQQRNARDEHEAAVELTGMHALLAALEARDQYTGEHSRVVVELARRVAAHLGLGERETLEVEQVAQLHDIGKVGIPDSILLKRGPLTAAEWELMRQHPAVGERVVANTESLAHLAPAIRAEHERYDGTGYPDRLRGERDPDREPNHPRLRRLPRDDQRPALPQGALGRRGARRASRQLGHPVRPRRHRRAADDHRRRGRARATSGQLDRVGDAAPIRRRRLGAPPRRAPAGRSPR